MCHSEKWIEKWWELVNFQNEREFWEYREVDEFLMINIQFMWDANNDVKYSLTNVLNWWRKCQIDINKSQMITVIRNHRRSSVFGIFSTTEVVRKQSSSTISVDKRLRFEFWLISHIWSTVAKQFLLWYWDETFDDVSSEDIHIHPYKYVD